MYSPAMTSRAPLGNGQGALGGMFAPPQRFPTMQPQRPMGSMFGGPGGGGGGILGNGGILSMLQQRNPQLLAQFQNNPFLARILGGAPGNTGIVPPAFGMGRLG